MNNNNAQIPKRGRPSLDGKERSPLVAVRVPKAELAQTKAIARRGESIQDVIREGLRREIAERGRA